MEEQNKLAFFEGKEIRKIWYNDQWYFSIVDVIEILTDSPIPRTYWSKLKAKIKKESELNPNWVQLKMLSSDGKSYKTDSANTEGVLRIVMSVPSPKAEPLKQWMAQVSTERIEETENPELGFERLKEIYKAKGYSDEWIERRLQSIETRKQLTEEWKKRGVKEGQEYSILTATVAKGTFGLTPSEHKELKGLAKPSENLRDHMTPLELIFTALSEEITRSIAVKEDAQGLNENHDVAVDGGKMAGKFRKETEAKGIEVVSNQNYLKSDEKRELLDGDKNNSISL